VQRHRGEGRRDALLEESPRGSPARRSTPSPFIPSPEGRGKRQRNIRVFIVQRQARAGLRPPMVRSGRFPGSFWRCPIKTLRLRSRMVGCGASRTPRRGESAPLNPPAVGGACLGPPRANTAPVFRRSDRAHGAARDPTGSHGDLTTAPRSAVRCPCRSSEFSPPPRFASRGGPTTSERRQKEEREPFRALSPLWMRLSVVVCRMRRR